MKNFFSNKLPSILIAAVIGLAFLSIHDGAIRARASGPLWLFVMTGQSNGSALCPLLEHSITAYYGEDARLICAAVPGSGLATWQPGQPNYINAVDAVNDARQLDGYVLKAVLFNGGEADAWLAADANAFSTRMGTFIDNFRTDTGNPYTFVVYNQLGRRPSCPEQSYAGYPQWDTTRLQAHNFRYNRTVKMVEQSPFTTGDYAPGLPCAHLPAANLQGLTAQYMIYLRGWIPAP